MELFSVDGEHLLNEKKAAAALERFTSNENNMPKFENSQFWVGRRKKRILSFENLHVPVPTRKVVSSGGGISSNRKPLAKKAVKTSQIIGFNNLQVSSLTMRTSSKSTKGRNSLQFNQRRTNKVMQTDN